MRLRPVPSLVALLAVVVVCQMSVLALRLGDRDNTGGGALVLGTGMVVSDALLVDGQVSRATVTSDRYLPPSHSLYGEPGLSDPLAGRLLAVGSAYEDSVPMVPTAKTSGFRAVDLDGRTAALGRDRVWTWVTWDLPDCTDECQGYTVGRNLSEEEVLVAARGASADRTQPAIATAALPDGMTLLLTGGVDLDGFAMRSAQVVSWTSGGGGLIFRVAPDEKLALLVRFWIDGRPTRIRGETGSAGSVAKVGYGGAATTGRAWSEEGRTLVVLGNGLTDREIDRFIAGLRAARAGEWEEVRSRVLDISSEAVMERCYDRGEPFVAVGRREGRYRWAVGFRAGRLNESSFCYILLTPDDRSLGSAGDPRPIPGKLSVGTTGLGGARDPVGLFVTGVAPPGTARVQAIHADGRTIDAELADQGPAPGERWFAAFLQGDIRIKPTIVALDDAGVELDRLAGGGRI